MRIAAKFEKAWHYAWGGRGVFGRISWAVKSSAEAHLLQAVEVAQQFLPFRNDASLPSWYISYVGKPDLIGPVGSEVLIEPVGSDGPIVTAVSSACPEPSRCYCPYAMMTHEALDAAAACRVPQVAQRRVDPGRTVPAAMRGMDRQISVRKARLAVLRGLSGRPRQA